MESHELFDDKFKDFVERAAKLDLASDAATAAMKNLKTYSECRPPAPELEPEPDPVPTTAWEKAKASAARIWDNETTRVLIKAGGSLAGVGLVVYSTIHKDHVIERTSLAQANQRNS